MGWTFVSSYKGGGIRNFLDREFTQEDDHGKWEILKSALVRMHTYYAACRRTYKQDGTVVTFALVALVKYNPRDKEGFTLGWKDMSEDMGPYACECPLSIMALLDPVEEGSYAKAWRDRVYAHHARRRKRPKPGDIFTLATPLTFVDGSVEHRFKTVRVGHRKIRYRGLTTGGLYRIGAIERFDITLETHRS